MSGNYPRSSSFGPPDVTLRTKRETWAVCFMSQDSSTAIDKYEANFTSSTCWLVTFKDILTVLSFTVLADNGNALIFFRISSLFLKFRKSIFYVLTICEWFSSLRNFLAHDKACKINIIGRLHPGTKYRT
ncbi:hypothetical protein FKM82_012640 [Ascaphus truei]